MSYLANSLDTVHKLHTLREKWAQVVSNSGPHLITSSPPLQICSQHKIWWQRTSFSFSSSSLGLSVLVLDFLWSTAGLLFSRARAWACCEISCWNTTSEQGMNHKPVSLSLLRDQLLEHDDRTMNEPVSLSLLRDQLQKHDIRTGNQPQTDTWRKELKICPMLGA